MQVNHTMTQLMTERETLRAEVERQDREIERLRGLITRLIAWEGAVDLACPELGGLLKAMYEARDVLGGK